MVEKISPQASIQPNTTNVYSSKYLSMPSYNAAQKQDTFETKQDNTTEAKPQTASQNKENKEGKTKKGKKVIIASAAVGTAAIFTLLGVLTNTRGWNKKVKKILEKSIKDGDEVFNFTKLKETLQASTKDKRIIKLSNFMNNMANFKDCYILPVLEKIPGLKQFAHKTSDIYKQTGVKMTQSAYKHANNLYGAFDSDVKKLAGAIEDEKVRENIGKLIEERNAVLKKYFTPECVQHLSDGVECGRIARMEKIMDEAGGEGVGICKAVRQKFNSIFKRAVPSKGKSLDDFGSFIAEDLLKAQKENYIAPLSKAKGEINEIDKKIISLLEENCGEDYILKHSKHIAASRSNAARTLNNAITTESNDLFDKMRDIKIGSAPTDILGMAGTAGLMGIYLAQAEDKNQRVEVALTTGVPLGLGMIATTFATMKMYAGIKSLAFGAVTTFAANTIGKLINNQYQKRNNVETKEPEIFTLDKATHEFTQKIKTP